MSAVTTRIPAAGSLLAPPTRTERLLLALSQEIEHRTLRRMQRRRLTALRLADRTRLDPVEARRAHAVDAYRHAGVR